MTRLKIPIWANALWALCVAALVAVIAYQAVVLHLDFVQILGLLWLNLGTIMLWVIGSGAAIYGLVWLVEYARGRTKPSKELKASSGDMANLV